MGGFPLWKVEHVTHTHIYIHSQQSTRMNTSYTPSADSPPLHTLHPSLCLRARVSRVALHAVALACVTCRSCRSCSLELEQVFCSFLLSETLPVCRSSVEDGLQRKTSWNI